MEPAWGPAHVFDSRAAWDAVAGNERLRVEAAARHGRATYFRLAPTWMPHDGPQGVAAPAAWPLLAWFNSVLTLGGIAFFTLLAAHNLRLGRGDRRGANRLSVFMFAALACGNILGRHWTASLGGPGTAGPVQQVVMTLGAPLFLGVASWLAYIGFEPYVRRQWPHLLVASTRLLDGRWRDPLVGRSVLAGVLAAIATCLIVFTSIAVTRLAGWAVVVPGLAPGTLDGPASFVGHVTVTSSLYLLVAMIYLAVLLLARLLLRSTRAAWIGLGVVFCALYVGWGRVFLGPYPAVLVACGLALAVTSVFVLWKSGLLALGVWLVVVLVLRDTPWTFDLTRWYAWPTWFSTVLIAGLAFWGFRNVLGRQSAFPPRALE